MLNNAFNFPFQNFFECSGIILHCSLFYLVTASDKSITSAWRAVVVWMDSPPAGHTASKVL